MFILIFYLLMCGYVTSSKIYEFGFSFLLLKYHLDFWMFKIFLCNFKYPILILVLLIDFYYKFWQHIKIIIIIELVLKKINSKKD